jgi:DNA-binding winged helix-turn-helix (wHTH) protein
MAEISKPRYKFGLFEAVPESGELLREGEKLRLQEQPFQVLVALLERKGEVVTREELRQRLWATDTFVDFDHSLNTAINKLRDTLRDGAANPRFIETLPRRGYRFIAPVHVLNGAAETPTVAIIGTGQPDLNAGVELPKAHPATARMLFGLLQAMYLVLYAVALWRLEEVGLRAGAAGLNGSVVLVIVLVTGVVGVAMRLYTLNATLFNYSPLGRKFQRLFPFVLVLDVIWAMSPFLIAYMIGIGLAFAACAALVYSPFAQRVLALMAYPENN